MVLSAVLKASPLWMCPRCRKRSRAAAIAVCCLLSAVPYPAAAAAAAAAAADGAAGGPACDAPADRQQQTVDLTKLLELPATGDATAGGVDPLGAYPVAVWPEETVYTAATRLCYAAPPELPASAREGCIIPLAKQLQRMSPGDGTWRAAGEVVRGSSPPHTHTHTPLTPRAVGRRHIDSLSGARSGQPTAEETGWLATLPFAEARRRAAAIAGRRPSALIRSNPTLNPAGRAVGSGRSTEAAGYDTASP